MRRIARIIGNRDAMTERQQPPRLGSYRPTEDLGPRRAYPGRPSASYRSYRPKRPPQRTGNGMKAVLIALALVGLVGAGALVTLYVYSPANLVRDELVRQVKLRTGRDLVVSGPTSLSVFGALTASMSELSLSAAPGMGGAPLVRARRLGAEVALWPLLRGEVIVDRVVLTEPVFELRVDAQGRRSWDFAASGGGQLVRYAQATKPGSVPPELADFLSHSSKDGKVLQNGGARTRLGELAIGEVSVHNGLVRYSDARSGANETVSGIELSITGRSLSQPIMARGGGNWRGERVALDGRLASVAALGEGRPARLMLAVGAPRGELRYDGSLTLAASGPQADGAVSIGATSARALAGWVGAALPPARGFGALQLTGDLKAVTNGVQLSRAVLRLDEAKAEGNVAFELGGPRVTVRADLAVTGLDLDGLLPDGEAAGEAPRPAAPTARGPAAPEGRPGAGGGAGSELSIEDLLRRDGAAGPPAGARVKGYTRRASWSEEPLSVAGLAIVDAEARVSLGRTIVAGATVDSAVLRLGLRNGALTANFEDVRLYQGRGRGVLTVGGGNPALPQIGLNVTAEGVSGLPLLKDAARFDWVDGKARIQVALGGQGGSEKAIVESLNGRAEFAFTDGAVVGVDVAQMLRGLTEGKFGGFQRRMTDKTPFSELAASFKIAAGVADTRDLRLIGPNLRMSGSGLVDLGKRQFDGSLRPRLVTTGAGARPGGFEIPLRLTGSWDSPRLAPDLDAVLKDPGKTVDAVRDFVKQPGVGDSVKGVLDAVQSGDSRGARERAKGLIDQFLKR